MDNTQQDLKIKNTDWAYLAGIIDGEGCIQSEGFQGQHHGAPRIMVAQKDVRLMEYLEKTFGGKIKLYRQHHTGEPIYRWLVCNRESLIFILNGCKSYLVIKKDQAEIALLMVQKFGKLNCHTPKHIREAMVDFRKKCDVELRRLKSAETSKRVGSSNDGMRCSELYSMVKVESNSEMELPLN